MGGFHCPFGIAFRYDEGCIDCGLCEAVTQEEAAEASKKIKVLTVSGLLGEAIKRAHLNDSVSSLFV